MLSSLQDNVIENHFKGSEERWKINYMYRQKIRISEIHTLMLEEWRDTPVRHYYVYGGFHGTDINGENEARFALYFPEKEKYEGRFFQYLSPAPESENATESQTGEIINCLCTHTWSIFCGFQSADLC